MRRHTNEQGGLGRGDEAACRAAASCSELRGTERLGMIVFVRPSRTSTPVLPGRRFRPGETVRGPPWSAVVGDLLGELKDLLLGLGRPPRSRRTDVPALTTHATKPGEPPPGRRMCPAAAGAPRPAPAQAEEIRGSGRTILTPAPPPITLQ